MKKLFRWNRILFIFVITLSFCAMAPAMAQGDGVGVFMALRLPQQEESLRGSDDSAVGSFVADAMRTQSGAELAVLCTGELTGEVGQGTLYYEEVSEAVNPDEEIFLVELTSAQLTKLLEVLVGRVVIDMEQECIDRTASAFDGFPHISGFTLTYDASAPAGQRVYSLRMTDGSEPDASSIYTVAVTASLVNGTYGNEPLESHPVDLTLANALYGYIDAVGSDLDELDWDRVTAIGARDNEIVDAFPSGFLLAVCIIIPLFCMVWVNRRRPT